MGYWSSTTRLVSGLSPGYDHSTLLRAAQQGDKKAFQELVAAYEGIVLRLALNLTRSEQDAQRVHQQVFLAAFAALPGYRQTTSFFIWIYRLAANYCIDHLRRQSSSEGIASFRSVSARPGRVKRGPLQRGAECLPMNTGDGARLAQAVDQLSPRERLVLVLIHYHGLRAQTIAEILEMPEESVRDALGRAASKLRMLLAA